MYSVVSSVAKSAVYWAETSETLKAGTWAGDLVGTMVDWKVEWRDVHLVAHLELRWVALTAGWMVGLMADLTVARLVVCSVVSLVDTTVGNSAEPTAVLRVCQLVVRMVAWSVELLVPSMVDQKESHLVASKVATMAAPTVA